MPLEFGVFDHIEPVPGLPLNEIYRLRLDISFAPSRLR